MSKSKTTPETTSHASDPIAGAQSGAERSDEKSPGTQPQTPFDLPSMLFVLPGGSLMSIVRIPNGVRVTCPACGAVEDILVIPGGVREGEFVHKRDDCPILLKIEDAIRRYERLVVRCG